ncbi:cohesin domain-containing protein [Agathobacter sp.]
MKKIIKKAICFICAILFFQSGSIPTYADESAAIYVQTAAALSDGMIRVSVYMKDTDNLAGVDAELFFDSTKVSFEGSSLGKAFSSSYADINYDKDNSKVHYVMLYPDGVSGDGIMMTVDFKLLGTDKSYQPELKINSLIDSSNEMNEIPYSIKYQQADGNWSDNTDQSGNIADKKIIADTLKEYGSKEDKKTDGNPYKDTVSVDRNNNLNGSTAEAGDSQTDVAEQPSVAVTDSENTEAVEQNATESNTESSTEVLASDKKAPVDKKVVESKKTKDKHGDYAVYVIVAVLIICVIAVGVIAKIRKNRH